MTEKEMKNSAGYEYKIFRDGELMERGWVDTVGEAYFWIALAVLDASIELKGREQLSLALTEIFEECNPHQLLRFIHLMRQTLPFKLSCNIASRDANAELAEAVKISII